VGESLTAEPGRHTPLIAVGLVDESTDRTRQRAEQSRPGLN